MCFVVRTCNSTVCIRCCEKSSFRLLSCTVFRRSLLEKRKSSVETKPNETSPASKTVTENRDDDDDDEMKKLLSQYMDESK